MGKVLRLWWIDLTINSVQLRCPIGMNNLALFHTMQNRIEDDIERAEKYLYKHV